MPKYAAVDVVGQIYKATGKTLKTPEGPVPEMKQRFGISPDIADAGMGLLALARERLNLDSTTATKALNPNNKSESKGWKQCFSKFKAIYR